MLIVLAIAFLVIARSEIVVENDINELQLASFAVKVYNNFCPECKTTLLIYNATDATPNLFLRLAAKKGLNMSFYSVEINKKCIRKDVYDGKLADLTIIFINTARIIQFQSFVKEVIQIPSFQSFSKYLIVFSSKTLEGTQWIENTFRFLWFKKALRAFVIFWKDSLKVYTYNPFTNEYLKDISKEKDDRLRFLLDFELFDLNGYPLKVFIWDYGGYKDRIEEKYDNRNQTEYLGYDGKLLTQVRNVLNVSLNITRESETNLVTNYNKSNKVLTITSKIGGEFLEEYNLDIWFTAIRAKANGTGDNLFLHERDDYVIILPQGDPIPEYLYFFLIVPYDIWIATSVIILITTLILFLVRKFKIDFRSRFVDSFFDMYRVRNKDNCCYL